MRRRPRHHPRSARPAPCDTTSAAPARTPGTRPPDNPRSSAPDRTATNGRSGAEGTPEPRASVPASVLSMHLESCRQPAAPEPPRPEPPPTPATRVAQTRHRPPLTTPYGRAPSEPPDPATGTPTSPTVAVGLGLATRPRTARSPECPQDTSGAVTRRRRRRDRRNRRVAPGTPRPRDPITVVGPKHLRKSCTRFVLVQPDRPPAAAWDSGRRRPPPRCRRPSRSFTI